jgi:multidrug efflux pump subunit AcrB
MNLSKFSVNNGVFLNILMIFILVLGAFSVSRMPREQYDEVPFYFVNVIVPYPGAGAEDVEQQVTIPIENEMQSLDELKEVNSQSSEGLSVVQIQFNDGITANQFDKLFADVRTNFTKAKLPDGVLDETIDDFSSTDFLPVAELVISGDVEYVTLLNLADLIKNDLRKISDVSGVQIIGEKDKQISIELNQALADSLGITPRETATAIQGVNTTIPGGKFNTGNAEYLVRTASGLSDVNDFSSVIIRTGDQGTGMIRVGQVASVIEEYDPDGVISRFNGVPSLVLRITKIPGGDGVAIIDSTKEIIQTYRYKTSEEISLTLINDSTIQIRNSLNVLINNVIMGLVLLVVILYLFVGLRNGLMTALGIPVTFAATFIILDLLGETFNTNTLFGLVLVLGLVVDHAIVLIENSYRLQEEGLSRLEAAIEGTRQVSLPVLAATGTTVAAFLPLMILPGTIGKFLRVIPLTVSIALIVSTLEALLFIPAHYAHWPSKRKYTENTPRWQRFKGAFSKIIEKLYARKGITVMIIILFMIMSFMLVPLLDQDLFSAEDYTLFYIDIEMAPGTPIERTEEVLARYEQRLLPLVGNGEVTSLSLAVGFLGGDGGNTIKSNVGQITVDIAEMQEGRKRSITEIMADARELTNDIPGPDFIDFRKATNGPPTSDPVGFRLFGDSRRELEEASLRIQEELRTFPNLFSIKDNYESGTPELSILVDQERAASFGMSPAFVGQAVNAVLEGYEGGIYFKENKEIKILVSYAGSGKGNLEDLLQLSLVSPRGETIPFSAVCSIVPVSSPSSIKRVDGEREIQVTSSAYSTDNLAEINSTIENLFNTELSPRYPDLTLKVGGEFSEFNDLLIQILRIFLIGVFLIYIILATQFNSYTQPLIILFSVPLAFMGVIIFLAISGIPFSTTVLYAGVALAGIAVNDSIVLISFINEKRDSGVKAGAAIIEAAETRLRPILLTSLTTIAGLIPTALGLGGKSVVWGPMAGTIIFGLIFSTITASGFYSLSVRIAL